MTIFFAAMENSLLVLESSSNGDNADRWKVSEHLKGLHPTAIAIDPQKNSNRVYCGTWNDGLWKTDNNGQTWEKTLLKISNANITTVSVSPIQKGEEEKGFNKLFVGTEPSIIYSSSDGGKTWEIIDGFNKLESSSTWSFPPRPWANHVRWIEPDANKEDYLFVAIEAGALIKSFDGGKTWKDRVKNGPYDTHTLVTHKKAPQRLYSAAGDGYFESQDYGMTWKNIDKGLEDNTYLMSIAVNTNDPQNKVISAASNAWKAHGRENPESFLYRQSIIDEDEKWELVTEGIFESKGTIISILKSNPNIKDGFYCLNNRGIYCSKDSGISWEKLEIPWPKEYYLQHPWALAIKE
jgi:photosystem II stability/assembly factor-like uncharacterized protein